MKRLRTVVGVGFHMLMCAVCIGQQGSASFIIVPPIKSEITALNSQGYMIVTNTASEGLTCTMQRAATLVGPSN